MQENNDPNQNNSPDDSAVENTTPVVEVVDKNIVNTLVDDEMKMSFLSYAMSVIVSRALPDVRDGLKPVHRRILYTMHEMGLAPNKPFKKSARVVGDVMGKYHPHGDAAIYETMVRMAQDFSLRYPLVTGQGNFGSIDGDSAAAMRYTEARMQKLTEELLGDIEKETVDFQDNYDESLKEPKVLPSKFPNLLINGSVGIAVGMATNIPPHNLHEVCDAVLAYIRDSDLTDKDLADYVKGPDFPTGGIICGSNGIKLAYETGHGKAIVRSKTHFEDVRGRAAVVIDEVPYQVNKANLVEQIAGLVRSKHVEGIHDIRDESSRGEIRVVIELKKDAQQEVILAHLLKHTRMQVTCGMNHICLVNGVPRVLTLKGFISNFVEHRFDVVTKRTQFELTKAQKRAHILLGLKIAIDNLDNTIKIVRAAKESREAKENLIAAYEIDDVQAQAVLDMKLQKLTGLERDKLIEEHNGLLAKIADFEAILASSDKKYRIITDEITEIKEKYGDERRTVISETEIADVDIEDLIVDEDVVVTITHGGYIKRIPLDTYRAQRRGGKGIIGTKTKEEDSVERIFVANSKSPLLFFTSAGQVQWLKVYQIPEGSRQAKGRAIVNLLNLSNDERVTGVIPIAEFREDQYLVLGTKQGVVKKSSLMAYSRPRAGGIHAIKLDVGDELINAVLTGGDHHIIIATKKGLAARFHEKDARELGRVSRGVRGIKLGAGDEVVGMIVADPTDIAEKTILTVTENGYGKRTKIDEYRLIKRGGKGVINIQTSDRNGQVVSVKAVDGETGLLLISRNGITIRTRSDQISIIGRNTQGVRLMNLKGDTDAVVSCAIVAREDDEDEELDELVETASAEEIAAASTPLDESDAESDEPDKEV